MAAPQDVAALMGVVFVGTGTLMLVRALARRIEAKSKQPPAISPETALRIERMERTIESVAIEIERISESQRFLTKVLAERERVALPPGSRGIVE